MRFHKLQDQLGDNTSEQPNMVGPHPVDQPRARDKKKIGKSQFYSLRNFKQMYDTGSEPSSGFLVYKVYFILNFQLAKGT